MPSAISTEQLATLKLDVRLIAPADALIGSAIITGGEATGMNLAGTVLPGTLEWSRDAVRGVTQLVLRYAVQTAEGHRLQVIDRATVASAAGPAWSKPITTATEFESMADPLAGAADAAGRLANGIVIGRLDATALDAGRLRLDLHRIA